MPLRPRPGLLLLLTLLLGAAAPAGGPAESLSLLSAGAAAPARTPVQHAGLDPQRVVDGALVVHYWAGGERLAHQLIQAHRAAPRLPALPGDAIGPDSSIHVFLAPDPARFDSLTAGRAPEWGAGVAMPDAGTIVLPAYASTRGPVHQLARVLRHELAHVALHRHLGPARIPRWFDEGYARWAAGEWDWEAGWQLRLAFALRRAPPLDSITLDWPGAEADARVAYLLATSAVVHLVEHGGERGLEILLRRWQDAGSFDTALRETYGFTFHRFEEDWRRAVRRRFGWLFVLSHSAVFWAFASLLVLALFAIRRRRDQTRLERLRATEPPDQPAYWLDPVPDPRSDAQPTDPPPPTDAGPVDETRENA